MHYTVYAFVKAKDDKEALAAAENLQAGNGTEWDYFTVVGVQPAADDPDGLWDDAREWDDKGAGDAAYRLLGEGVKRAFEKTAGGKHGHNVHAAYHLETAAKLFSREFCHESPYVALDGYGCVDFYAPPADADKAEWWIATLDCHF